MKRIEGEELEQFKAWLTEAGCQVLAPAGPDEVLRYKAPRGICIIRRSKSGKQSCVGTEPGAALGAFRAGNPWKPPKRQIVEAPSKRPALVRAVVERDGRGCWYCGCSIETGWTIEHLLAVRHGGPTRAANVVLACLPCNTEAGDLSVAEKVLLREEKRLTLHIGAGSKREQVIASETLQEVMRQ